MVNFRLMKWNLHLMSQDKQENIQKKLQGCISKGEGGASLDVPVMFKFADCISVYKNHATSYRISIL